MGLDRVPDTVDKEFMIQAPQATHACSLTARSLGSLLLRHHLFRSASPTVRIQHSTMTKVWVGITINFYVAPYYCCVLSLIGMKQCIACRVSIAKCVPLLHRTAPCTHRNQKPNARLTKPGGGGSRLGNNNNFHLLSKNAITILINELGKVFQFAVPFTCRTPVKQP